MRAKRVVTVPLQPYFGSTEDGMKESLGNGGNNSAVWGNPKGPLFKGASFKTQVDRLPTATRTCNWPALWRLHLQMGFATTEPCSALDWLSKAEGGGEWPPHSAIHFPVEPHWTIHFPVEKSALRNKPL